MSGQHFIALLILLQGMNLAEISTFFATSMLLRCYNGSRLIAVLQEKVMIFFSTERQIRKKLLENSDSSKYIREDADPEKVVAETMRLVQLELARKKEERLSKMLSETQGLASE